MKLALGLFALLSASLVVGCDKDEGGGSATEEEVPGAVNTGEQPGGSDEGDGGEGEDLPPPPPSCPSDMKVANDGTCVARTITEMNLKADCVNHSGFWYDQADVAKTTASEFDGLKPTCHASHLDACPTTGNVYIGSESGGLLESEDVTSGSVYGFSSLAKVYSTIRCFDHADLSIYMGGLEATEFDASVNPNIQSLSLAYSANLKKIDFPRDTSKLEYLNVSATKVPPSNYTGLASLNLLEVSHQTGFTSLDVSKLTKLFYLDVGYTDLTSLDLSHNDMIQALGISGTTIPVASLNLARYPYLSWFEAADNGLTSLAGIPLTNLNHLDLSGNNFTTLNLSGAPHLGDFFCSSCQLTSLDLSMNTEVSDLSVDANNLASLDVTGMPDLWYLSAGGNNLTSINLSGNPLLSNLYVSANALTSIDLSANVELFQLDVSANQLTALNLVTNVLLRTITASDNDLTYDGMATKWDLHTLTQLESLEIRNNPDLVLNFETGVTMHSNFLSSIWSSISVEQARWASFTGPNKPAWQYNGTDPYGFYQAP